MTISKCYDGEQIADDKREGESSIHGLIGKRKSIDHLRELLSSPLAQQTKGGNAIFLSGIPLDETSPIRKGLY